jgi:ketosteroid isomerase-like protein
MAVSAAPNSTFMSPPGPVKPRVPKTVTVSTACSTKATAQNRSGGRLLLDPARALADLDTWQVSQQNLEMVRRWLDVFNAGEMAGFLDAWDADCEFFSITGSQLTASAYHGHEGMRSFHRERAETWTGLRFDAERILAGGEQDVVVAVGLLSGEGRGSGVLVEQRIGMVFKLRGTKIRYCRAYPDPEEALETAGLEQ